MPVLTFVVHVAAVVVAVAGVRKLADPTAIDAALRAAHLPHHPSLGRALGAVEVGAGGWVLAGGGAAAAALLALLYIGFLAFIAANRLRGLDVACGCLGESTAPPGLLHVMVNLVAATAATAAVIRPVDAATGWFDLGGFPGAVALGGVIFGAALVIVGLEVATRSRAA